MKLTAYDAMIKFNGREVIASYDGDLMLCDLTIEEADAIFKALANRKVRNGAIWPAPRATKDTTK